MNIRYTLMKRSSLPETILVNAWDGQNRVAHFLCHRGSYCSRCYPDLYCKCTDKTEKIWIMRSGPQVREEYKLKGIGTGLYRTAEIFFGLKVMPDGKASDEGKTFRECYEKKFGSWRDEFVKHKNDEQFASPDEIPYEKKGFIV